MAVGLMRRQADRLAYAWRSYWKGPYSLASLTAKAFSDGLASSTGVNVSEQTALTYSAFWACVNAISTDVASYPLIHYKRASSGGKDRFTDSKLYRIVHDEPNPEMTSFTMRQALTAHALTWGNGYAEIERDGGGRPLYLWPITPDRVTPKRDLRNEIVYEVTRPGGGRPDIIPAADMLHIPGLGFDGLCGYSVVAMARESIGLGLATERFGGTFFGNGATFGGVISYKGPRPTEMSDKNYTDTLTMKHTGVDRAHKLLALYNGAEYDRYGMPPNDAQFLETRLHQVEEMCRYFRMPPHKIQHLLRSTNNNIEHQGIEHYTDTTRPWCVRWEQECNRKLIPSSERRIQFFEHMIEGALRGDLQSRYAAYAVARQWGWLSADDVRERENMNPLPGGTGKVYLLPLNMVPADRINEVIDKQVAPTPAPVASAPPAKDDQAEKDAAAANRAIEAIRAELVAAQVLAAQHLARSEYTETLLVGAGVESTSLKAERDHARADHAAAVLDVAVKQALLLEASERATRLEAEREAAVVAAAAAGAAEVASQTVGQVEELGVRAGVAEERHESTHIEMVSALATVDESAAALATQQAAERQRMVSVIAAHRGLIADAMGRMIRRETETARRAQATPEKLRNRMATFYPSHEEVCNAALLPAIRAHLAWKQSDADPATVTQAMVRAHIEESQRQLRLVLDSDPEDVPMTLESTLRRWESERVEQLADVILREEIDHVSRHV